MPGMVCVVSVPVDPRFQSVTPIHNASRKHKTRCNGLRPQCDVCTWKHRSCHWPDGLAPGGYKHLFFEGSTLALKGNPDNPPKLVSIRQPAETLLQAESTCDLPSSIPLCRRLIDIFVQTHHLLDLCGCIHLDSLQDEEMASENRFLLESIFSLSALYLPPNEAKFDSRFTSAKGMVRYYRNKAQASSRQSSDQPTSKATPAITSTFSTNRASHQYTSKSSTGSLRALNNGYIKSMAAHRTCCPHGTDFANAK